MMNPTGKIELYKGNAFSITGEIPDKLREYLHTKVEPSVEYRHCSLVQQDKAEISLLEARHPDLAKELEVLLNVWVDRIESEAKAHKQKQFQLRKIYLKEEDEVIKRYSFSKENTTVDYKGKSFDEFPYPVGFIDAD
jgi:hypothetical protein